MTKNQISRKLTAANFEMKNVIDVSRDYLEVFNGDGCDYEGNMALAQEASKITGLNHLCNIAYGGWMLSSESFSIDSDNCL